MIGWLLLASQRKIEEEKVELRDSISQLKHHINDLIVCMFALKEMVITYSTAEIAESQTPNLIMGVADLQQMAFPASQVSTVKVNALIRKK